MTRRTAKLWPEAARNPALPVLVRSLRHNLRDCETILDVGCGQTSPIRFLTSGYITGVDGYAPAVEQARILATHDKYVTGDVRSIAQLFADKHFDACVALDVIEHLPTADGLRLVEQMEALARKRVIFFTPNGFMPQRSKNGDLQEHLSGWSVDDFERLGYSVFGMCGPKTLRGEYYKIKRSPRVIWTSISIILDLLYTRAHPRTAAALLAVKERA